MRALEFSNPRWSINWRRRVRAHLATLPPGDAADDLAMIEAATWGGWIGGHVRQLRLRALLRAARDDQEAINLDGQRALLDALRERIL